jgi:hypothetical protein
MRCRSTVYAKKSFSALGLCLGDYEELQLEGRLTLHTGSNTQLVWGKIAKKQGVKKNLKLPKG